MQTKVEGRPSDVRGILKERNKKRKEERKSISESDREQRHVRKEWKKRHWMMVKRQKEVETFCRASTQPSTSSECDQTPVHAHTHLGDQGEN